MTRDWIEVPTFGGEAVIVAGRCHHAAVVDVDSTVTGETLARLCPDCDTQLPASWVSPYAPPHPAELADGVGSRRNHAESRATTPTARQQAHGRAPVPENGVQTLSEPYRSPP